MEQESLLQNDQAQTSPRLAKEYDHRQYALPTIILRGCALLFLLSICLNCILAWLLAQQQSPVLETSEYGQSVGHEQVVIST